MERYTDVTKKINEMKEKIIGFEVILKNGDRIHVDGGTPVDARKIMNSPQNSAYEIYAKKEMVAIVNVGEIAAIKMIKGLDVDTMFEGEEIPDFLK